MGKAAENERIKLRATFYNNLAVGLALAGVLIPYLGFIQSGGSREFVVISDALLAGHIAPLTDGQGFAAFAFVLALASAAIFRYWASTTAAKIQD
jgi:hypothetical protein